MSRTPRLDRPSFDIDHHIGRPGVKDLLDRLTAHYARQNDPDPDARARLHLERIFTDAFDHLAQHYSGHKKAALEKLLKLQKEALDFYDHVLGNAGDVDVARLERILRDMEDSFRQLARKADDLVRDVPPVVRIEAPDPTAKPTVASRAVEDAGTATVPRTPGAAKTPARQRPSKPHELRAELQHDQRLARLQEEAFGQQVDDLDTQLEAVRAEPPSRRRDTREDQLQKKLQTAKDKETAARELAEKLEAELTALAPDPGAGYYRRTQPELVPAGRMDQPPASLAESAGAGDVRGERMQGQRVLAAIQDPAAMRTHIEAGAAEDFAYKDALTRGEIGVQRPGRINEGGADFITARRNPAGEIEIVFHDATVNPDKKIEDLDPRWVTEAAEAIEMRPDGSTRLQLHNSTLEDAIRDAFARKRFVVEATLVEVRPDGVLFTPLK